MLDLTLRPGDDGWRVVGAEVRADSVSEVVAGLPAETIRRHAEPLRRAVQGDHRAALDWTRRQIGTSSLAMSTCFASVADVPAMRFWGAQDPLRARGAAPHARGGPADRGHRHALSHRRARRALNYSELPAGPLSVRHLFNLYPFPNTVVAHRVTGLDLLEMLERAAAQFLQLRSGGTDQPLIDPTFPGFAFSSTIGCATGSTCRNPPAMTCAAT